MAYPFRCGKKNCLCHAFDNRNLPLKSGHLLARFCEGFCHTRFDQRPARRQAILGIHIRPVRALRRRTHGCGLATLATLD
jgi:hypothetical protein